MGIVYSRIIRQARRFNVENRALRAIERTKPVSAPKHPTTKKYEETLDNSAITTGALQEKNIKLDGFLKEVYVSSTGMTPEIKRDKSKLPTDKRPVEDDEFGFWQPSEISEGKASLATVLKFLSDHQSDPTLWNSRFIAKEYKLNEKDVENVLDYYKTFNLYIPKVAKPVGGFFRLEDFKPSNIIGTGFPPEPTPEKHKDKE